MEHKLGFPIFLLATLASMPLNAQSVQYPQKIEWIHEIDAQTRAEFAAKPRLVSNLQDAYKGWLDNRCYSARSREECKSEPNPPFTQMFDAVPMARADLNSDNKVDLILFLSNETGRSGAGNCGIMEYRIYENTGRDYRLVAKTEMVANYGLFIGRPKGRGVFRDIHWKSVTRACDVMGNKDIIERYNRRTRSYTN